ncbi:MAG: CZB domain-containing protein [Sulfuricurvum sp.]|uniref:CZB domain-containing protein n=1 Tax=Sulfuricurvum sp. TaxID=2025608 RepID=UPI0026090330|nr:CZB domain-containing protein [Sulfuricurvum sp.]MDD2951508.1 CZB domain-containing protein [Sulfuricurvum sp.]MDD5117012.1 CZB domain-containing protein [Sulfuricurvum sp.]
MTQKALIVGLHEAQKSHHRWISRVEELVKNNLPDSPLIESSATECVLGKWLNHEFKSIDRNSKIFNSFTTVDTLHKELHDIYLEILSLKSGRGQNKMLFGFQRIVLWWHPTLSISSQIKKKFHLLKKKSEELFAALDVLEGAISMHGAQLFKYTGKVFSDEMVQRP